MTQIKRLYLLIAFAIFLTAQLFAQPGINGAANITGTNVDLNTYTYLTANATSGATSITVNNSALTGANFSTGLSAGDLILIIQMQGASVNVVNNSSFGDISNYNNVGLYEFKCVASVPNATTITLTSSLSNNYTSAGHVQIVRIPRYTSFNLAAGNSVRPASWNGNTGGITAIEISGNATINGTITASGRGFRGGSFDNNSQAPGNNVTNWYSNSDADGGNKGESIAGHESSEYQSGGYRYCRGAVANGGGGGNSHNAGGGGGANAGIVANWNGRGNPDLSGLNYLLAWNLEGSSFSASTSSGGGRGGYTYADVDRNALLTAPGNSSWGGNNRRNLGGYGGRPLDYSTGRLFFGGGGGAGDGNNNAASGGANGGGLVFIISYGNISGNGTIEANGANAQPTSSGHNDAPGGGGGGGTIVLASSGTIANSLNLNANGGSGGNQLISGNESEGPGGGGGGGYIAVSNGSPVRNVNGGINGTSSSSAITEFIPNGATRGGAGTGTASFDVTGIVGTVVANAGADQNFCNAVGLNANSLTNATGSWSVISGTSGSFANSNSPSTTFFGDSSQTYLLEWTVVNRLCLTRRDTLTLNPICLPLPVELISFNGELVENQTNIQWTSAKQENFKHFVLEKNNSNGNWFELATINPDNSNSTIQNYFYADINPGEGDIYYRLKMVDLDGSFKYSATISFNTVMDGSDIVSFPVPAENQLNLSGLSLKGSTVSIMNNMGQVLELPVIYANDFVSIDLSNIPAGYYVYKVIRNGQIIIAKSFIREIR
ncbi:MAG: T9SS type A sorting domain-containing protein [Chitinophagaceae bacterium]